MALTFFVGTGFVDLRSEIGLSLQSSFRRELPILEAALKVVVLVSLWGVATKAYVEVNKEKRIASFMSGKVDVFYEYLLL